jgi:hypothetical protein
VDIPKYAKLENERRFLVRDPPDLSGDPGRLIEDLYLDAGRLRMRALTHPDGRCEFKFCKKYQSDDPASGPIVNIYLTAAEYDGLAVLPGRPLRKRRHRVAWGERGFGVDVFEGALAGLILCEAEAESAAAIKTLAFPPWAGREVTADSFFAGGNLSRVTADELKRRL